MHIIKDSGTNGRWRCRTALVGGIDMDKDQTRAKAQKGTEPDLSKSPLARSLARHMEVYYGYKSEEYNQPNGQTNIPEASCQNGR